MKVGKLPSPGKEVWKDVHTQVMKLSTGKTQAKLAHNKPRENSTTMSFSWIQM